MSDLISREDTIADLHTADIPDEWMAWIEHFVNVQPSVDSERKTGKWEYIQYDGNPKIGNWHCSNCRLIVNLGFEGAPYYDYCPGCGAKMEVQNDS